MPVELIGGDAWNATITAPSGGDPRNSASVRALGQKLADNTVYLKNRLGRLADVAHAHHDTGFAANTAQMIHPGPGTNSTAWVNINHPEPGFAVTVNDLRAGDVVLVHAHLVSFLNTAGKKGWLRLGDATIQEVVPGAYTLVTNSDMLNPQPFALMGKYIAAAALPTKTFHVMAQVEAPASIVLGAISMTAVLLQQ